MNNTLEDSVVPAGGGWSRRLDKGQMLRIVDLEGKQAVDFLCYNAHDPADRYAAADTMKINPGGIFLSTKREAAGDGGRYTGPEHAPDQRTARRDRHPERTREGSPVTSCAPSSWRFLAEYRSE